MARGSGQTLQDSGTSGAREVLSFTVGGERLALPAAEVAEIIRARPTTRVPHAPPSLLGVLNLRGMALPVISAAALLDRPASAASPATRIVVLQRGQAGGSAVGLLVESVVALRPLAGDRLLDIGALLARDFGGLAPRAIASRPGHLAGAATAHHAAASGQDQRALIAFTLAGQDYALALADVMEVAALPAEITALPGSDAAMLGAAPWRGHVLPVVSLRVLLGLPAMFDRAQARMVVLRIGGAPVGLAVDGLREILRVGSGSLEPVPPILTRGSGEARIEALCRVQDGRRLISILAPDKLFDPQTAARVLAHRLARAAPESATMATGMTASDDARQHQAPQQFVIFQLGDEQYGLPIAAVNEVVRRPDTLTRVPRAPAFLEGVMNLRGRAVPVINQRQRFALPAEAACGGRIVIVTIDGLQAGFVVDAVSEVLSATAAELQPAPELAPEPAGGGAQLFNCIATVARDGRMILQVDPKVLLDRAKRDVLAAISAAATDAGQAALLRTLPWALPWALPGADASRAGAAQAP